MSVQSGYTTRSNADDLSSTERDRPGKRVYFDLRERVDVELGQRLEGSVGMSELRRVARDDGGGEDAHQRILDTLGLASALGGHLPVRYYMHESQEGYGRMRSQVMVDGISAIPYVHMKREVRAVLAGQFYWDVDMVNCQPSLLRQKFEEMGIQCPLLDKYVQQRDQCLQEIVEFCGVTRDEAKNLFIRLVYYGSTSAWYAEVSSSRSREVRPLPDWVVDLQEELRTCVAKMLDSPDFDDLKRHYKRRSLAIASSQSSNGTATQLSLYLQTLECECVRALADAVQAEQRTLGGIIYDGVHIEKLPGEDRLPPSLLCRLKKAVARKTGMFVELSVKEFAYSAETWLRPLQAACVADPIDPSGEYWDDSWMNGHSLWSYDEMKRMWERRSFKIVEGGNYIREEKEKRVVLTDRGVNEAYKHLHYAQVAHSENGSATVRLVPFITRWVKDPKLRRYKSMVFRPPPMTTPDEAFNIWNGFAAQRYVCAAGRIANPSSDAVRTVLDFFDILCGRERAVVDYLLDWIAQIFQQPSKKTGIAILLKGEEGCGKNRCSDLVCRLLGSDKNLNTSSPKSTLYGDFTNLREGRFLIVINEASGADNFAANDKIKDMITSETFVCNAKCIHPYTIECFARFMFTTNNDNCLKVESGSRRYQVIEVSSELKGNTEYFRRLSDIIDDPHSQHEFYLHLMSRDISGRDWINDRPLSSSFADMVIANLPYEHHFVRDVVLASRANETIKVQLDDFFQQFVAWLREKVVVGSSRAHDTSVHKFGTKMTKLVKTDKNSAGFASVWKKRVNSGIVYVIDAGAMRREMLDKHWITIADC